MTWLVIASVVFRVTLILAAAAATSALLRRSSAAARHLLWTVAIASSLLVPALSITLPHWNVRLFPASIDRPLRSAMTSPSVSDAPAVPVAHARTQPPDAPASLSRTHAAAPLATSIQSGTYSLISFALAMWLAGAFIVLLRLAVGTARTAWMARAARPVDDETWGELARQLASALGIHARVAFLEGTSDAMPVAWGIFRHRVLLPRGAAGWPIERQRVVLLHELAHVKRRDCLTQLVAQIACAAYWFNPLAWLAARRLRTEREHACDDLVLATGTRGSEYADHLLDIARSLRASAPPTWAAVAMAHRSQLEGRLMAILDPALVRRIPTRRATIALGIAFTLFAAIVALVTPVGRATLAAAPVGIQQQSLPTPTPTPVPAPTATAVSQSITSEVARGIAEGIPDAIVDVVNETVGSASTQKVTRGVRGGISAGVKGGVQGGVPGGVREGVRVEAGTEKRAADPKIVAALVEALKDTDADVRKQALLTLAQLGAKEAIDPLRTATKDTDPDVRAQAIFALGEYQDPANLEYFAAALGDANESVVEKAAFALGELGDTRGIGPLSTALKSSRSADVRRQCAFALGQIGDASAVDALIAALHDEDAEVRAQAAFALGEIGDARAADALMAALKDPKPEVRRKAAFAISQITK